MFEDLAVFSAGAGVVILFLALEFAISGFFLWLTVNFMFDIGERISYLRCMLTTFILAVMVLFALFVCGLIMSVIPSIIMLPMTIIVLLFTMKLVIDSMFEVENGLTIGIVYIIVSIVIGYGINQMLGTAVI